MSMQLQSHPPERRKVARQKSFLRGMIQFNNRRSVLDCLIRDISPYGARLVFSDTPTIPDVLELNIPQKEKTLRVHVIWRHGREVGVAFAQITELEQSAEAGDLAERVTRLEAEVSGLKRALRKLRSDGIQELDTD
jgi:PilZ domain